MAGVSPIPCVTVARPGQPSAPAPARTGARVEVYRAEDLAAAAAAKGITARDTATQSTELARLGALPAPIATDRVGGAGRDAAVGAALASGTSIDAYLAREFHRDGWSSTGAPLRMVLGAVDEHGSDVGNAYWNNAANVMLLGSFPGTSAAQTASALDVLTHETIHGVMNVRNPITAPATDIVGNMSQRALSESWADVLASRIDGNLVLGESLGPQTQRDLRKQEVTHTSQLRNVTNLEEHSLAGIPSTAAVRTIDAIGHGATAAIWYKALDYLRLADGLPGAAAATTRAAQDLYPDQPPVAAAVAAAWKSVGV